MCVSNGGTAVRLRSPAVVIFYFCLKSTVFSAQTGILGLIMTAAAQTVKPDQKNRRNPITKNRVSETCGPDPAQQYVHLINDK